MKVLLINPVPKGSLSVKFPVLPLGIALIAAVANDYGADVEIISGQDFDSRLIRYLQKFQPDIVGMQTFVNNLPLCFNVAGEVKTNYPESITVLGGVEITNLPEKAFDSPYIDCVIPGEGERTFRSLLENINSGFSNIAGLIWSDDKDIIHRNPGLNLVENLDQLPLIPYHLFYKSNSVPVGHVLTHRGCHHHCSHCPMRFRAGVSIRAHSSKRIVETINYLKSEFNIGHIEFYDENFTMHPQLVYDICESIGSMKLTWNCTARFTQLDIDLVTKMAKSGCSEILFGIGSGVPRLQKVLGVEEDLQTAPDLISNIRKLGIKVVVAFSLGIPTETKLEFQETVNYALNSNANEIRFEPSSPLPGTALYELAKSNGRFLIKSWSEYTTPGQLIYIPANRSMLGFKLSLLIAKIRARKII